MSDEIHCHSCQHIGLSGTTPVRIKQRADGKFEARMGGSMFGSANLTEEQMAATGHDPFHSNWHDNYFSGVGLTEAEAIEEMKKDMAHMAEFLWA